MTLSAASWLEHGSPILQHAKWLPPTNTHPLQLSARNYNDNALELARQPTIQRCPRHIAHLRHPACLKSQTELSAMKFSYRITKYHQYLGDENQTLTSPAHEWTSFGDIDKGLVTLADYEAVEQAYIQTISAICRHLNVDYLKIKKLSDFNGLKQYRNNQRIRADEGLTCLLRLILREKMWCK